MGIDDQVQDEGLNQERSMTEQQVVRIEESAEKISQKATFGNGLKIAVVISTLILAATINSLAKIPDAVKENAVSVKENSAQIEASVKRMDRHVEQADKHFEEIREDMKDIRTFQMEILKELRK